MCSLVAVVGVFCFGSLFGRWRLGLCFVFIDLLCLNWLCLCLGFCFWICMIDMFDSFENWFYVLEWYYFYCLVGLRLFVLLFVGDCTVDLFGAG